MRFKSALLAAFISVVLMTTVVAPRASSQPDPSNMMKVECKLLLSGLTSIEGSGSVELTFAGNPAIALRNAIFNKSDADGNMWLNSNETGTLLDAFSDALVGKIYWGIAIESATNFTGRTDAFIADHSSGLVGLKNDATLPIVLKVDFDGSGKMESKVIETAQGAYETFATAIEDASGYSYSGAMVVKQRVTTIMLGSLTNPHLKQGSVSAIRNPFGEVLWYSFTGSVGPSMPAQDMVSYEAFSIMENQQISFIVLFLGCLMILRTPRNYFDKFEKLHPKKFRKNAKQLMSVWILAIVLAGVLVVLYLVPFIFSFASRNALIYAAYLYLLVPFAIIGEHLFARSMYNKAALSIPDESTVEVKQALIEKEDGEGEILCKVCYMPIEAGLDMFQCTCDAAMHVNCAEKVQTCPSCREPLFPQRSRSIRCKSCGETFMYSGTEDSYSVQCTKCGAFQEDIKAGRNYLVADEDPRNAFMMVRAIGISGRPALCLTTQFPGKIRSEYDLRDVSVKWFSDSSTDIDNINPKDLDGDPMEIASTFLMTSKEAGILIEGIDTLIELNGFDKVLAFIKKLNDLAAIHGSTIVLSLDKKKLSEAQFKIISDEFDEIHDYQ
jgi:LSD1 subclass zinc finger protein